MDFSLNACKKQTSLLSQESMTATPLVEQSIVSPNDINEISPFPAQEYLVIWGKETWPDGDCILWIANPDIQETTRTIIETPWCNFAVLNRYDKQQLVSFPRYPEAYSNGIRSSEIIIYEIDQNGYLQHKQTIALEGLRITDTPQFGVNDIIYFSGIKDNRESIYTYDQETQTASLYITTEIGFATSPVISPNGQYIAYEVWKDHESKEHNSRDDCGQLTCFSRFLHIWDIESNTDIDLASYIKPFIAGESYYSHCEPEWSDTGNLLAFNVGCEYQTPGSIIVFDVSKRETPVAINSVDHTKNISKFHWVEGNRLILNGTVQIFGQDAIEDGYLIYSASTNTIEKMIGLPERNIYDYDLIYFNDWTNDARFAVGQTQIPNDERTINVVIANSWDELDQENYIQSPDEFVDNLRWSPTSDNIAYRSYNWKTEESQSRFIIIDATGSTLFDSNMINIIFPKFQWYWTPP